MVKPIINLGTKDRRGFLGETPHGMPYGIHTVDLRAFRVDSQKHLADADVQVILKSTIIGHQESVRHVKRRQIMLQ